MTNPRCVRLPCVTTSDQDPNSGTGHMSHYIARWHFLVC